MGLCGCYYVVGREYSGSQNSFQAPATCFLKVQVLVLFWCCLRSMCCCCWTPCNPMSACCDRMSREIANNILVNFLHSGGKPLRNDLSRVCSPGIPLSVCGLLNYRYAALSNKWARFRTPVKKWSLRPKLHALQKAFMPAPPIPAYACQVRSSSRQVQFWSIGTEDGIGFAMLRPALSPSPFMSFLLVATPVSSRRRGNGFRGGEVRQRRVCVGEG